MYQLSDALFTGTQINYYIVCPAKLWFFSRQLSMEFQSEDVHIGRFIQDSSYSRGKKDVIIDDKIGIDLIREGDKLVVCEVKKSRKLEKAHRYQLYYYLYYLKKVKGISNVEGRLLYPTIREVVNIILDEGIIREIEDMLMKIKDVVSSSMPLRPVWKPYCRRCAYFEFCWV
ncbi:MAG: CRISPR-associated protein Cas4 [Candidatus Thermoplasmatota archaeon]